MRACRALMWAPLRIACSQLGELIANSEMAVGRTVGSPIGSDRRAFHIKSGRKTEGKKGALSRRSRRREKAKNLRAEIERESQCDREVHYIVASCFRPRPRSTSTCGFVFMKQTRDVGDARFPTVSPVTQIDLPDCRPHFRQ